MTPAPVDDCVQSILEDNPSMDEQRAYAICNAKNNRGELENVKDPADIQADEDPCWDGYTMVGTKTDESGNTVPRCVPEEDVPDANMANAEESDCPNGQVDINGECIPVEDIGELRPPSIANSHLLSQIDTEPIERIEESDGTIRYANLRLLTEGVWTDAKSETPTLYPEDGIANIEAEYDESYNGPPVNAMHDVDPQTGEVNQASHAGYVDPNSLTYTDGSLMGDIVLDTSEPAGEFADENLQSALESNGKVGFGGPSVELDLDPDTHIQDSDHPRAVKEINGGYLTGLGLVKDPADKNIEFAKETRQRAVAMSGGSQTDKRVYLKETHMADVETIRETLDEFGIDIDEMDDEEVMSMAENLHSDLMEELEMGDYEEEEDEDDESEMEEHEDEEEDEDAEMMNDEALDGLREQIDDIWGEIEELREQMIEEGQMSESLAEAKEELADAETVNELKEAKDELDKRLSEIENESKESKTMAEGNIDEDWYDADGLTQDSPNRL